MAIWVLGINHKTAPVALRERVAFDPSQTSQALHQIQQQAINEVMLLSTCNRTEIYGASDQPDRQLIGQWLACYHEIDFDELAPHLYFHTADDAVRHTMRVACGLDSLVLGEPQILGQMKSAFAAASDANTVATEIGRLCRHTFSTAKQVRTDTAIGENPVSVAFAAVRMAQHIFSDLSQSRALMIGAGETIELVARHLHQAGTKEMVVANRTLGRAQKLAEQFGARSALLEDIPEELAKADIVITSTASPLPIVGKGMVEKALKQRRHQPIFMVDIAVPRDIEEAVAELADIYLYSVDDLRDIIEENVRSREDAARQAEELIDIGVEHFNRDIKTLDAVQTVTRLRSHVEALRDQQIDKALKQLNSGTDIEKVLRQFAHSFTNKVLHEPTVVLRQAGAEGRLDVLEIGRELFQLEVPSQPLPPDSPASSKQDGPRKDSSSPNER